MKIDPKLLIISFVISFFIGAFILFGFSSFLSEDSARLAYAENSTTLENESPTHQDDTSSPYRAIIDNLVSAPGRINKRAVNALQAFGPDVIPDIIELFDGSDSKKQEALLSVLKTFHTTEVTRHLLHTLNNFPTRSMAIKIGHAININKEKSLGVSLTELAANPDPALRLAAAIALKTCSAKISTEPLLRLVKKGTDDEIRKEALLSLASAPLAFLEEGIDSALKDKSPKVRYEAVLIIQRKELSHFSEDIKKLLENDSSERVRKTCARTLVIFRRKLPSSGTSQSSQS